LLTDSLHGLKRVVSLALDTKLIVISVRKPVDKKLKDILETVNKFELTHY